MLGTQMEMLAGLRRGVLVRVTQAITPPTAYSRMEKRARQSRRDVLALERQKRRHCTEEGTWQDVRCGLKEQRTGLVGFTGVSA